MRFGREASNGKHIDTRQGLVLSAITMVLVYNVIAEDPELENALQTNKVDCLKALKKISRKSLEAMRLN